VHILLRVYHLLAKLVIHTPWLLLSRCLCLGSLSLRCGGLGGELRELLGLGLEPWLLLGLRSGSLGLGLRSGSLGLGLESLLLLLGLLDGGESRELLGLRGGLLESLLLLLRCRGWPSLGWWVCLELFQCLTLFRTELLLLMSNLRLLGLYETLVGLKLVAGGLEGAGLGLGGCLGLGSWGKLLGLGLRLSWDKLLGLRCWLGLPWSKLLGLRNKPLRLSGKLLRLRNKLLLWLLLRSKPLGLCSKLLLLRSPSLELLDRNGHSLLINELTDHSPLGPRYLHRLLLRLPEH